MSSDIRTAGIVNLRAAWRGCGDNVGHETGDPAAHTPATDNPLSYAGYRLPPDVISYAFLLSSEKHACRGRDVA
jgi:hypothetical protein